MATYDFNMIDEVIVKKLTWATVSCPPTPPEEWGGQPITVGGSCDVEGEIAKVGATCYQCNVISTTTISKLMVNGTTVYWAKMIAHLDETGGSAVSDVTVYLNRQYGSLPSPTKTYYAFNGWFTASTGGSQVLSTTIVTDVDDHTLYARWLKQPQNPIVTYLLNSQNAIYYFVENPNPYPVTLYFEHSDSTPDANSVTIAANSDEYIDITGLSPGTSYTTYFQFFADNYSGVVSQTHSTQSASGTDWVFLYSDMSSGAYSYDSAVSNTTYTTCPTTTTIDTWLTSSYPPGNYTVGHVMRVYVATKYGTACGYYWFECQ